ncbi:hypothetical protein GCM10023189_20540 [Nibrella saemangeumensis]|uniref:DUF3575 domain-containing protein n=1 Tax=Nibrella saemangeumensis TaxID=1084526 RepID=A0ABP8MQ33_9BACT
MNKPFLVLFFFISIGVQAQRMRLDTTLRPIMDNPPRWVIKFSPQHLFDPDNTVQFGLERILSHRQSVQGEFGYGSGVMNLYRNSESSQYLLPEYWRGRAEWRFYTNRYRTNRNFNVNVRSPAPLGNYLAVELFYKQANAFERFSAGRECVGGQCAYFEQLETAVMKYVWGSHFKVGRQFVAGTENNRLVLDMYLGVGIRFKAISRSPIPAEDQVFRMRNYFLYDPFYPGSLVLPSLTAGLKIGYIL